ncbi:MAG: exonuclease SbcCD subunit D [Dehalococcoidia bacterium]|nr:exonuclease SbcCD subunit D [Dehalococcoidia bacterium]
MMKIVHFADLHLGVETYGNINSASGSSSRLDDYLKSFDRLVDYVLREKVDLVLFCGDAYKSRSPSQTQQREFARRIKILSDNGISVFLLAGNHDMPNASERAMTIEIYETLAIPHVTVAQKPQLFTLSTPSDDIQIVALPWLRRSMMISRDEVRGLDTSQLNAHISQTLTAIVDKLSSALDPTKPAILAAHVWVQGAITGSEGNMNIGNEHTLLVSSIAKPCFDYVALGHIHRHQVLNAIPPVVYSGSLDSLDFGDEHDCKGFYCIDIDTSQPKRQTKYSFQPVPSRSFKKLSVQVQSDDTAPTESILAVLLHSAAELGQNIVRLELSYPEECIGRIDEVRIRQFVLDELQASYFDILRHVSRQSRPRLEGMAVEALAPEQAFETYIRLRRDDYTADTLSKLEKLGKSIIQEADEKNSELVL